MADQVTTSNCTNLEQIARDKWVCVCTENSCDELEFDWPKDAGQAVQVVSSQSGKQFSASNLDETSIDLEQVSRVKVSLNLSELHQSVLGWGGAFTDSAAINAYDLSENLTRKLIESYYGHGGLQYNFGRVPIGGSDFSTRKYTYDENKGDFELKGWSLAPEDTQFKIPMIQEARRLCESRGVQLKLFGSPWSAPTWMKTSGSVVRGSLIEDKKYYAAYANYLIKFYRTYRKYGIEFWGGTIQNEPVAAFLPFYWFNSMNWTPRQMSNFVANYLGPALEAEGMGKDKFKLIVGDDSLGFVEPLVTRVLANEAAQQYISGVAFHWYTSGSILSYDRLNSLYDQVKDKIEFMMMSEGCIGSSPFRKKVDLGSWDRGEAYALDIIEDMLRHTSAWIDWNLALDPNGGPNWSKNFVDSPIIVDKSRNLFYKQPMYYVLAHFSRFFKPGSIRVGSKVDGREDLDVVAVQNDETGHLVANILNRSDKTVRVSLQIEGPEREQSELAVTIEGKSMNSIILKL